MSRITVYLGHYGSGKTEICLNAALRLARESVPVTLVDLDIVNPYFRSGEQRERLEAAGVELVTPTFEGTTVDVPALPARVQSVFADAARRALFDVGGDPTGAAALGRYKPWLERDDVETLCVVNTRRPFTGTARAVADMVRRLEERSRLRVAGLVCNTNLARESTAPALEEGLRVVEEAACSLCIPVASVCGLPHVLDALPKPVRDRYSGRLTPLTLYMRPGWLDEEAHKTGNVR